MTSYLLYNTSHGESCNTIQLCTYYTRNYVVSQTPERRFPYTTTAKRYVCVYVPLMQPHRSTEGNQFTLTSFLHAHSRSRTHTRTHSETCVATTLLTCVCMFVCMYASAACFFFCCCICCRCCCFYFPFHEPILTRVLLFQLLTKQLVRRSGLTKRTRQRDERRTGVASY